MSQPRQSELDPLYFVASIIVWYPYCGSRTITVCWPKGTPVEEIARRFIAEADRKFKRYKISHYKNFAKGRAGSTWHYQPPLGRVKAIVQK